MVDYAKLELDIVDRFAAAEGKTREEMLAELTRSIEKLYGVGREVPESPGESLRRPLTGRTGSFLPLAPGWRILRDQKG